jgi:hypothetical protein
VLGVVEALVFSFFEQLSLSVQGRDRNKKKNIFYYFILYFFLGLNAPLVLEFENFIFFFLGFEK